MNFHPIINITLSFLIGFFIAFFTKKKEIKKLLTRDLSYTERSVINKMLARKKYKL